VDVNEADLPATFTHKFYGTDQSDSRIIGTFDNVTDFFGGYEELSKCLEETVSFFQQISEGSLVFEGNLRDSLLDPTEPRSFDRYRVVMDEPVYLSVAEFLAILKVVPYLNHNKYIHT
jgi:hypothetical protein